MGHLLPERESLFKFFGTFGAAKWVTYRFWSLPSRSVTYPKSTPRRNDKSIPGSRKKMRLEIDDETEIFKD